MSQKPKESKEDGIPKDWDAERALLGAMLIDPDAYWKATERMEGSDLYYGRHQVAWTAYTAIAVKGQGTPNDSVTLRDQLEKQGYEDTDALMVYLWECVNATPSALRVREYATIIHDKARLRKMIVAAGEMVKTIYAADMEQPIDDVIAAAESLAFEAAHDLTTEGATKSSDDVMDTVVARYQWAKEHKGELTGVTSGLIDLDKLLYGFQPGNLIVLAGRPSMGKTALAVHFAMSASARVPVGVFSLEMSEAEIGLRFVGCKSNLPMTAIARGQLNDDDETSLATATKVLRQHEYMVNDSANLTVESICLATRRMIMQSGVKLVIIDHLGLIGTARDFKGNRVQEVSYITRQLKGMARSLKIPVIVLSQLNRAVEKRSDHHPHLHDLRESGTIEQDADVVLFVYRDDYYNDDSDRPGVMEIAAEKQRNGEVGTVEVMFTKESNFFQSLSPLQEDISF